MVIAGLGHPAALAFDAVGSLWVSDIQAHTVVKYSASQLEASGSPAPQVVLTASANSLLNPSGLAFDASGNLWVANIGNETVVAFGQAQLQLAATVSPAPHITLSSNAGSLGIPTGLAFDGGGSLWVMSGEGELVKFNSTALGATGAPTPSVRLLLNGHVLFWSVAFWPKPVGLPLN